MLSLDVYASATIASVLPPTSNPFQLPDTFDITVNVNLQTAGSGSGVLVIDPTYTFTDSQPYPETLEAVISGDVGAALVPQVICIRPTATPGGAVCAGETLVPITLGNGFTFTLEESNEEYNDLPPTSTLAADLNLWAVGANGNVIPVTLATEAVPEPPDLTILGFGLLVCLVRCGASRVI